jgi:hypothetical protein
MGTGDVPDFMQADQVIGDSLDPGDMDLTLVQEGKGGIRVIYPNQENLMLIGQGGDVLMGS